MVMQRLALAVLAAAACQVIAHREQNMENTAQRGQNAEKMDATSIAEELVAHETALNKIEKQQADSIKHIQTETAELEQTQEKLLKAATANAAEVKHLLEYLQAHEQDSDKGAAKGAKVEKRQAKSATNPSKVAPSKAVPPHHQGAKAQAKQGKAKRDSSATKQHTKAKAEAKKSPATPKHKAAAAEMKHEVEREDRDAESDSAGTSDDGDVEQAETEKRHPKAPHREDAAEEDSQGGDASNEGSEADADADDKQEEEEEQGSKKKAGHPNPKTAKAASPKAAKVDNQDEADSEDADHDPPKRKPDQPHRKQKKKQGGKPHGNAAIELHSSSTMKKLKKFSGLLQTESMAVPLHADGQEVDLEEEAVGNGALPPTFVQLYAEETPNHIDVENRKEAKPLANHELGLEGTAAQADTASGDQEEDANLANEMWAVPLDLPKASPAGQPSTQTAGAPRATPGSFVQALTKKKEMLKSNERDDPASKIDGAKLQAMRIAGMKRMRNYFLAVPFVVLSVVGAVLFVIYRQAQQKKAQRKAAKASKKDAKAGHAILFSAEASEKEKLSAKGLGLNNEPPSPCSTASGGSTGGSTARSSSIGGSFERLSQSSPSVLAARLFGSR